jgi:hypothetical protein
MEMGVIPAGEAEVDCLSNLGERCSGPATITRPGAGSNLSPRPETRLTFTLIQREPPAALRARVGGAPSGGAERELAPRTRG